MIPSASLAHANREILSGFGTHETVLRNPAVFRDHDKILRGDLRRAPPGPDRFARGQPSPNSRLRLFCDRSHPARSGVGLVSWRHENSAVDWSGGCAIG